MYKRTEAIVLHTRRFNGADLIVTYLTRDDGIVTALAKSPLKVKSRFGSSLEPLTYARVAFLGKEQTNLPKIVQSDIIKTFESLRNSYRVFLPLSELLSLTIKVLPEKSPHKDVFSLLLETLNLLEEQPERGFYLTFYKIKLLQYAGFAPELNQCVRCGRPAERFYYSEGGLLCSGCLDGSKWSVEVTGQIRGIYNFLIRTYPYSVRRIKTDAEIEKRLEELINTYINYMVT